MSLANYKSLCIEKYKLANPDKDIPSNMGCKWTDAEEQELLDNIKNNIGIEEIAKKHSRTKGAITARLEVIAIRLYNDNMFDIEHIEDLTGLSEKTIKDAIDKKGKNERKFPTYNNDSEIINLKKDLQKCNEEIRELKANVKKLLELESRNKRDDIDDLKKQIQNMLDITNIKNDITELKRFANITL
jgi:predicted  nucleic acid-binding Zn-ribbon protein